MSDQKATKGQRVIYHRGEETYPGIVTEVHGKRVDVAWWDENEAQMDLTINADWRDGAAYGPVPDGGGGPP